MKFFFIGRQGTANDTIGSLLAHSCQEKGLEFIWVEPANYNFAQPLDTSGALLYRAATSGMRGDSRAVELSLMTPQTTTFYRSFSRSLLSNAYGFVITEKNGLPTPKTFYAASANKELLKEYADSLGFPLIIKALGGSHGVGVMKVDSYSSLVSVVDLLVAENIDFILRKFIEVTTSARLIVLGNKVIDSIEYSAPQGDFRSNEGHEPNVTAKKFSAEIEQLAVAAVQADELEFGGVDILIDNQGQPYITEVNFPCFFPRCQMLTGTDISGQMVEYLLQKSATLAAKS